MISDSLEPKTATRRMSATTSNSFRSFAIKHHLDSIQKWCSINFNACFKSGNMSKLMKDTSTHVSLHLISRFVLLKAGENAAMFLAHVEWMLFFLFYLVQKAH
jgi:hypothetical protein